MGVEVYFANGVRKLRPYYHGRASFAKGRWFKRTLLEVLVSEFNAESKDEYIAGIRGGKYRIIREGRPLDPDEVLSSPIRNSDVIETNSHKHEPPVKQWCDEEVDIPGEKVAGIDIVYEDENLLVLDKPNGIPIHPTGMFYQNTLTEILKSRGKEARPCYRLDKVTSGLLIMGKTKAIANEIQAKIRSRDMNKIYLARVSGKFPGTNCLTNETDGQLPRPFGNQELNTVAESATYTIELKKSFPAGLSVPKQATTCFCPLRYFANLDQTLVACKPLTGRTHQIRIHLARLGFPIVNDPFYNLANTKYPLRSKFILEVEDWENSSLTTEELRQHFNRFDQECDEVQTKQRSMQENSICKECGSIEADTPPLKELELWLHAWKYSDSQETIAFETRAPSWTEEDCKVVL